MQSSFCDSVLLQYLALSTGQAKNKPYSTLNSSSCLTRFIVFSASIGFLIGKIRSQCFFKATQTGESQDWILAADTVNGFVHRAFSHTFIGFLLGKVKRTSSPDTRCLTECRAHSVIFSTSISFDCLINNCRSLAKW